MVSLVLVRTADAPTRDWFPFTPGESIMRCLLHLGMLLGGLALAPAGVVRAAEVAGTSPLPPVEALIAQLSDRSFRVREAAGRALEARGEESLPLLRKAAAGADPENRRRVEVLTQRIERSVLLAPKYISLVCKNTPICDVLADLSKQTGYQIQWQSNDSVRVTLNLPHATYWEVMDRLMLDVGCTMNIDEQHGVVFLAQQDTYSPYCFHSGPFRVMALNFSYNRYVNLMNVPRNGIDPNQQNDNLSFAFMVSSEPKVPLAGIGEPRLTKAEDENGQSLLARNNNEYAVRLYENGTFRRFELQAQAVMHKANKDATKARLIRGKLPVLLLASQKPEVTIEKIATLKKKQTVTGTTVELEVEDVQEQNKTYAMTVTIKRLGRNPDPDPNWINNVWQRLELLDAKGRKYQSQITNFINNSATMIQANFQFMPGTGEIGPAVKLVFNQWVTIPHEVEFEFRDVPLP